MFINQYKTRPDGNQAKIKAKKQQTLAKPKKALPAKTLAD